MAGRERLVADCRQWNDRGVQVRARLSDLAVPRSDS